MIVGARSYMLSESALEIISTKYASIYSSQCSLVAQWCFLAVPAQIWQHHFAWYELNMLLRSERPCEYILLAAKQILAYRGLP